MTIHIWAAGADKSYPVEGPIELVTFQAGGSVAARTRATFAARGEHSVTFDGADFETVVSDLGKESNDETFGIPAPPPESIEMTGPAGMHYLLPADGKVIYISIAAPSGGFAEEREVVAAPGRKRRSGSPIKKTASPAGQH